MTAPEPPLIGLIVDAKQTVARALAAVRQTRSAGAIIVVDEKNGDFIALEQLEAASPAAPISSVAETKPVKILKKRLNGTCEFVFGEAAATPKTFDMRALGDAPKPRVVNASVRYGDGDEEPVPAAASLAVGQSYLLQINVGARDEASLLPADTPALPEPPITAAGLDLLVSVISASDALVFAAPTQPLHLPAKGDSAPVRLSFSARTPISEALVWVHVYYRLNLLQTIELRLAVTATEQDLPAPAAAKVIYSRTKDFADVARLGGKELTLRLFGDGDSYRMSIAWPGDGERGRRDPVRGLTVALPVSKQALTDAVVAARNTLYETTWQPSYRKGVKGTFAERRESLYQLAVAGNRLYTTLFYPENATAEQARSLEGVRAWLADALASAEGERAPTIQIIHENPPGGLPWALLYPAAVAEQGDVDYSQFWGCSYRLEILTPQFAENAKASVAPAERVRVAGGAYTFRVPTDAGVVDVTAQHRQFLDSFAPAGGPWEVELRDQADQASFGALLEQSDIVYMFCHGHTAKSADDSVDWVGRFREQLAKLPDETKAKYGDLLKLEQERYQPSDPNLGDSWLMWNQSLLPLRQIKQWTPQLRRKPLVMLNMCESAQVLPALGTGFVPFFSQIGARGVVGTECPMLATFAAEFGQRALQRLAAGEAIGDALVALRKEFIEQERNPLGLAYTYYGDADLSFKGGNP
ncbi:MAG TPA: CHAT domain-containing protein [Herpetosiphonaceae bacterium]